MENHCYTCAYKKDIPGDAHIECMRDFTGIKQPTLNPHGVRRGWSNFPLNFDPVWVGKCDGFSKEAIKIREEADALLKILSLLK